MKNPDFHYRSIHDRDGFWRGGQGGFIGKRLSSR